MDNLTQDNFNERYNKAICCVAKLTNSLLKKIKIGSKDINCKLQKLQVIQKMLEYLKCYKVIGGIILPGGSIEISTIGNGDTLRVFIIINGNTIYLSSLFTSVMTDNILAMTELIKNINIYQKDWIASYDYINNKIKIEGPCNTIGLINLYALGTGTVVTDVQISNNRNCGIYDGDNCLSEKQMQQMFDYIGKECKDCYHLPGFKYS